VQVMSIGFLVAPDEAMIWRGPMATQALEQLLRQTNWKDLDYLIVDMPPGTGDIQLTLSQRVPITGAVVVTTPQDIALLDARKGIKMFEKVGVPILGIVENMAVHVCSQCGHVEHIFGADGGQRMAADYKMDYLGALPLDIQIRQQADSGNPTVVAAPDSEVAGLYKTVARKVALKVAEQAKDFSSSSPPSPSARAPEAAAPGLGHEHPGVTALPGFAQRAPAFRPRRAGLPHHPAGPVERAARAEAEFGVVIKRARQYAGFTTEGERVLVTARACCASTSCCSRTWPARPIARAGACASAPCPRPCPSWRALPRACRPCTRASGPLCSRCPRPRSRTAWRA
jgi:hypothetical protein